ncbi:MAG: hypothetical protein JJU45_15160 [Acidimicrobiia bacterium]|nr:hypothetical protein [Acidimicrobiia bacterium]
MATDDRSDISADPPVTTTTDADPAISAATSAATNRTATAGTAAIVVAAGAVAAAADAAPTGRPTLDLAYRVALALTVALSGSRAGPWSLFVGAGLVAMTAVNGAAQGVTPLTAVVVAIGAVALAAVRSRLSPDTAVAAPVGAASAAAALSAAWWLGSVGPHGSGALVVAIAMALVLFSGWRRSPHLIRRATALAAIVAALGMLALLGGFALAGAEAWHRSGQAVDATDAWIDAAGDGDRETALGHLDDASMRFAQAGAALDRWYARPARALPLVDAYHRAGTVASHQGEQLTDAVREVAEVATYDELRVEQGRMNLSLLEELQPRVERAATRLGSATVALSDVESPWLLPFVAKRVADFDRAVRGAHEEAQLASSALEVVPSMLGGDGPRSYLLLLTDPTNPRQLGGAVTHWTVLDATDGQLSLGAIGRADGSLVDVTDAPDLPTAAAEAVTVHRNATGQSVNGVVVMDTIALGAFANLTPRPVEVPGLDELGPDDIVELLVHGAVDGQVAALPDGIEPTEVVAAQLFSRLLNRRLPGPRGIGRVLGPMTHERRLALWSAEPDEQAFLAELDLAGEIPHHPGEVVTVAVSAHGEPVDVELTASVSVSTQASDDRPAEGGGDRGRLEIEVTVGLVTGDSTAAAEPPAPTDGNGTDAGVELSVIVGARIAGTAGSVESVEVDRVAVSPDVGSPIGNGTLTEVRVPVTVSATGSTTVVVVVSESAAIDAGTTDDDGALPEEILAVALQPLVQPWTVDITSSATSDLEVTGRAIAQGPDLSTLMTTPTATGLTSSPTQAFGVVRAMPAEAAEHVSGDGPTNDPVDQ